MLNADQGRILYDRFGDSLLRFLRARTASTEDAEDLLQEVFLRVHTGLCCLEAVPALEAWIFRTARNRLIDHYRSRKPTEEYTDTEVSSSNLSPATGHPDEDGGAADLAASLRAMAEALPSPHREVLLLADFEGLSQAEVAFRLGLSLSAAKSRIQRARERLKADLLACCHVELDRLGGIIAVEERCPRCDLARAGRPT